MFLIYRYHCMSAKGGRELKYYCFFPLTLHGYNKII